MLVPDVLVVALSDRDEMEDPICTRVAHAAEARNDRAVAA